MIEEVVGAMMMAKYYDRTLTARAAELWLVA
jgi:hypothetical protein